MELIKHFTTKEMQTFIQTIQSIKYDSMETVLRQLKQDNLIDKAFALFVLDHVFYHEQKDQNDYGMDILYETSNQKQIKNISNQIQLK